MPLLIFIIVVIVVLLLVLYLIRLLPSDASTAPLKVGLQILSVLVAILLILHRSGLF